MGEHLGRSEGERAIGWGLWGLWDHWVNPLCPPTLWMRRLRSQWDTGQLWKGHCSQTCGPSPAAPALQWLCKTGEFKDCFYLCLKLSMVIVRTLRPWFCHSEMGKRVRWQSRTDPKDSLGLGCSGDTCRIWNGGFWRAGQPAWEERGAWLLVGSSGHCGVELMWLCEG